MGEEEEKYADFQMFPHCSLSHFRGEISFLLLCGVAQWQAWQRRDVERRLKKGLSRNEIKLRTITSDTW